MKLGKVLSMFLLLLLALSTATFPIAAVAQRLPTIISPAKIYGDEARQLLAQVYLQCSPETRACIGCHLSITPDIVYDWLRSKHAWHKPADVYKLYAAINYKDVKLASKFKDYQYVVGCYECHGMFKDQDRPDIIKDHFGYRIVTIVTLKDCSQCHYKEAMEISWTWHGFGALNSWLKVWYKKIVVYAKKNKKFDMLPPVYEKTGKDLITWEWIKEYLRKIAQGKYDDPEVKMFGLPMMNLFKEIVSPLYPASGVLAHEVKAGGFVAEFCGTAFNAVMKHPLFSNAYVYLGCMECHGSLVIPYKVERDKVYLWGWPNNGVGRVDPDGSLGTCTACHPRHQFSIEYARKPETCGQCHLGVDHPHIEVYEESKHGNIYAMTGESWNWEALPWRVGIDFTAPTCATCHMSTLATPDGKIVVQGTHDLRRRIVWDSMHFFAFPKPKWPDHTQNAVFKGASQLTGAGLLENRVAFEGYRIVSGAKKGLELPNLPVIEYYGELKEHREEMKAVCKLCHSPQWVDNYFIIYDANQIDYNITANFAFQLLKYAWKLGIHDPKNKIDEFMEIMWYYIWHHDGRRWRAGVAMMGPDYTHWLGIVDTVMDKLGRMISYYELMVKILKIEEKVAKLAAGGVSAAELAKLQQKLNALETKLAAMEATVPALKSSLENLESKYDELAAKLRDVEYTANTAVQKADVARSKAGMVEASVERLGKQVAQLKSELNNVVEKLSQLSVATQKLDKDFKEFKSRVRSELSSLKEDILKVSETAVEAKETAEFAESRIAELAKATAEISKATKEVLGMQGTATLLLGIGALLTVVAVISLIALLLRRS